MFHFDNGFLQSVGLNDLPEDQKANFLQLLYEELEVRVGSRLSEGMDDKLLAEFVKLSDADDNVGALEWLEKNRPDYKQVVTEELEKLKQEVMQNKDKILGNEPAVVESV